MITSRRFYVGVAPNSTYVSIRLEKRLLQRLRKASLVFKLDFMYVCLCSILICSIYTDLCCDFLWEAGGGGEQQRYTQDQSVSSRPMW